VWGKIFNAVSKKEIRNRPKRIFEHVMTGWEGPSCSYIRKERGIDFWVRGPNYPPFGWGSSEVTNLPEIKKE